MRTGEISLMIDVGAGERDQLADKIEQNTVSAEKRPRDRLISGQKI